MVGTKISIQTTKQVKYHTLPSLIEPITAELCKLSLLPHAEFRILFSLQRERHWINLGAGYGRAERVRVPSSECYRRPIRVVATYNVFTSVPCPDVLLNHNSNDCFESASCWINDQDISS